MVQPFYSGVLMGRKVATRGSVILHDLHLFSKQLSLDIPFAGGLSASQACKPKEANDICLVASRGHSVQKGNWLMALAWNV